MVKEGYYKEDEVEWSGVEDWLRSKGGTKVTKGEVLDYMKANEVQVEEIEKGKDRSTLGQFVDIEDETKFSQYTLPGGENYRELLLTMPVNKDVEAKVEGGLVSRAEALKGEYYGTHFTDEPNVLATSVSMNAQVLRVREYCI